MRFPKLLSLILLTAALPAFAQVEANLKTVTDLSDAYQQVSSQSEVAAIYDFTPVSRAAFEPYKYLTYQGRSGYLGTAPNGQVASGTDSKIQSDFNPPSSVANPSNSTNGTGTAVAAGIAFGLRQTGTGPQVRMYWWPTAYLASGDKGPLQDKVANADIVGTPLYEDTSGNITLITNNSLTIAQIIAVTTHVRFAIKTSSGTRTIDLPAPWKIWDSPATLTGTVDSGFSAQTNMFTSSSGSGHYDPWSQNLNGATTTTGSYTIATGVTGPSVTYPSDDTTQLPKTNWYGGAITYTGNSVSHTDVKIGQFFYTPDYLAFIFGGTQVRYIDPSNGQVNYQNANAAVLSSTKYPPTSYTGGFAIPDAVTDKVAGWANGLPNMARYQAMKYASINVMLSNQGTLQFAYRFLDPTYGTPTWDGGSHEETQTASFTSFGTTVGTSGRSDYVSANLRKLRIISLSKLVSDSEDLQTFGPRAWDFLLSKNFWEYTGQAVDPFSPESLNYALANTYRQVLNNDAGFNRGNISAGCANTYVIVFPGQGFDDSKTTALDGAAANVPGNGNNVPNAGGSYSSSLDSTSLAPATDSNFSSAMLSSIAAHGAGSTRNWGAPWTLSINSKTRRIQTIVISVGVPGAYHFGNTNAGSRAPHEQLFRVAQWGDPARTAWQKSNGGNNSPDLPIQLQSIVTGTATQNAKVYYFVGSDPATLQEAFNQVAKYIVSASAALSAPATPATGVRASNAAYFGTFKTALNQSSTATGLNKTPLWSGNLYGMGVLQSTQYVDSTQPTLGTHDVLSFFGYDTNSGTNGTDPSDIATGIPNFDNAHLWDTYDLFGTYYPTDITANAAPTPHVYGDLTGAATKWSGRAIFTMAGGKKVRWPNVTGAGTSTPTLNDPDKVVNYMTGTTGSNPIYEVTVTTDSSGNPVINTSTSTKITAAEALSFIAWVRGAYDAADLTDTNNTYNRLDIMGDVVNSAPLAVELTPTDASYIAGVLFTSTDAIIPTSVSAVPSSLTVKGNPFTASKYFDPHGRLIIVGTNVGQLECFFEWSASYDSGTKDAAGNPINFVDARAMELWSFIPRDFWQLLYQLYQTRSTSGLPHSYMVDGDPALYHVDKPPTSGGLPDSRVGAGEKAVVIFGNRKGARSYYGLQISDDSSSTTYDSSITPSNFKIAWVINPQDPTGTTQTLPTGQTAPSSTDASLIQTMGMSTSVPAIAQVYYPGSGGSPSTPPIPVDALFLGGGYSNPEMDARYKNTSSTLYGNGMGRLILGLDPLTGNVIRNWDLHAITGAISEGVTPVKIFEGTLTQRLYFADTLGSVWCINNNQALKDASNNPLTVATGYRVDDSYVNDWNGIRPIYKASANKDSSGNALYTRFTTRPDAINLQGGFPSPSTTSGSPNPNPLTVMVAIGAGDRNNPTDKDESYTIGTTSYTQHPPSLYRFMVFADRQDSTGLGYDSNAALGTGTGIPDGDMKSIPNDGTGWATDYNDGRVVPGDNTTPYVLENDNHHNGYYVNLGTGTLSSNSWSSSLSYDKVLVSPLIKQGLLFFSVYNIANNSGYNCSPNSFTRTFRQCDITRPLALNLQTTDLTAVSDIQGSVTQSASSCSGLAFYFNSLSSQLVDAGTRVLQGGALSQGQSSVGGSINTSTQAGQNTPSIQSVKDTDAVKGIRVRAWRVVR